ncbi:hypothetical protein [Asticcacaulis benevestitus]|uniref:hypothetical protein n=1 Tax=Asticcacaulis benevestitus TaxID=347481 RepID=UPI0012DF13A4|nr:hypothetical protein [Asticcacaulis benevestitus]
MIQKGGVSLGIGTVRFAQNVFSGMLKQFSQEPWADRRGRLQGNLKALGDCLNLPAAPDLSYDPERTSAIFLRLPCPEFISPIFNPVAQESGKIYINVTSTNLKRKRLTLRPALRNKKYKRPTNKTLNGIRLKYGPH